MKIAVISMIRDTWGGSEELWYDMAKQAISQGHEVMHLSFEAKPLHPKMHELIAMGLKSYTRPGYQPDQKSRWLNGFRLVGTFFKKRLSRSVEKIFQLQPDLVIYNGTCYSIAGEKELIKQLENNSIRFYIIAHLNSPRETVSKENAILIDKMYKRARNVFFVSNRSLQTARKQVGIDIPNASVIRNPVNMKETDPLPFPRDNSVQLAAVGNLIISHKGQDILLSILASDRWRSRNFHLNIYGSGPDEQLLRGLAVSNQLSGKISFHGRVNDIRAVWKKNHLLLMPSHFEGMPIAIVEAMLCGRPTVASDVGGITEWIENGKSGFVCNEATVQDFSNAMELAWENKEDWEKMGQRAHDRAMELYDPHAGQTLLELIYK